MERESGQSENGFLEKSQNDSERPKLKRKEYEKKLRELQTELCSLQDWVKHTVSRAMV
jgi:polyphosphate kinase 2 (PPK2 family)